MPSILAAAFRHPGPRAWAMCLALATSLFSPPGRADDNVVDGDILVKLSSADALPPLLAKYPLTLADRFGTRPIYRLHAVGTSGSSNLAKLVNAVSLEPGVLIAETNALHRSPEARKNQPWAIGNADAYVAQWAPDAMRLAEAQRLSVGAGMRIAVLDTGVDASHPALAGRLLPGFDFVDFDGDASEVAGGASRGHGTHVAGLVALAAPGARIMPLRVLDADGVGNVWVLAEALLYAVDPDGNPATDDGAHVINLSLGTLNRTRLLDSIVSLASCDTADSQTASDLKDSAFDDDRVRCDRTAGVVVVAAAGNDASASVQQYPAAERAGTLLAVAASNAQGRLAAFSNSGSWISLAAPGEGITSSMPGGGYASWSGTSMAAPLVAGSVALLRAAQPTLRPAELVRRLQQRAGNLCGSNLRQIDIAAALTDKAPPVRSCR